MLRSFAVFFSAALFIASAGCGNQAQTTEPSSDADTAAPNTTAENAAANANENVELQVLDYEGIQNLIASKKGKVVVLDCWSTSCPPCVKEFPGLVALHKKHGDQVACISVSFDYNGLGTVDEAKGGVLEFLRKQGATFDNVISSTPDEELYKQFGIAAIPVVYVYDQEGKQVKRFDNEEAQAVEDLFSYEDVSALVEQLLNQQD